MPRRSVLVDDRGVIARNCRRHPLVTWGGPEVTGANHDHVCSRPQQSHEVSIGSRARTQLRRVGPVRDAERGDSVDGGDKVDDQVGARSVRKSQRSTVWSLGRERISTAVAAEDLERWLRQCNSPQR